MSEYIGGCLLILALGGATGLLAWYALGVLADLLDERENESPAT